MGPGGAQIYAGLKANDLQVWSQLAAGPWRAALPTAAAACRGSHEERGVRGTHALASCSTRLRASQVLTPLDAVVAKHSNPTLYDIVPNVGAKKQGAGGHTFIIGGANFNAIQGASSSRTLLSARFVETAARPHARLPCTQPGPHVAARTVPALTLVLHSA